MVERAPGADPRRRAPTCSGPSSRITLAADRLHPLAARPSPATGLAARSRANPSGASSRGPSSWSTRTAEALDIVDAYRPPERPRAPWTPRPGVAAWATEAPRGLLFHRYELDDDGRVVGSPDRAADQPEPGGHRGRPGRLRAVGPRPAARRGDAPPRAAHPQLRPVHLVRDPLPRPARWRTDHDCRSTAPTASACSSGHRPTAATTARSAAVPIAGIAAGADRRRTARRCAARGPRADRSQLDLDDLLAVPVGDGASSWIPPSASTRAGSSRSPSAELAAPRVRHPPAVITRTPDPRDHRRRRSIRGRPLPRDGSSAIGGMAFGLRAGAELAGHRGDGRLRPGDRRRDHDASARLSVGTTPAR